MKIRKVTHHGNVRWRVAARLLGKQIRSFHKTKEAATLRAASIRDEIQRHGSEWLLVPPVDRLDCLLALRIARENGFRLVDAAQVMAKTGDRPLSSKAPTVAEAIASCMTRKRTLNLRSRSLRNLEHTLEMFAKTFASKSVAIIKPAQIETWLLELKVSLSTRKGHRTNVQTLFSHAVSMDWIARNPVAKVPVPIIDDKPPGILTVAQCTALMASCHRVDPGMVPFAVLCLFMGIRPEEVLRLSPAAVDPERGIVTVDVSTSKTRRRRIVTMPANAKAWLKASEPLNVKNWQTRWQAVREDAGLLKDWPHDAMRHSFASYAYAKTGDAAKVAAEMGNSPEMLFRHYRELVSKKDALAFFSILPPPKG